MTGTDSRMGTADGIRNKTAGVTLVALGAAFLTVCSWITVPYTVPFTAQTFGVFLILKVLGGGRGTAAIALYIALGAVGLPVFSGFGAGIGALSGPTGGYIAGFLLTALIYRLMLPNRKSPAAEALVCFAGLAACYAAGTAWFSIRMGTDAPHALLLCVVPYLIPDLVKLAAATLVSPRLVKIIKRFQ